MPSVNKFIGIGNLVKDPEMRQMSNGESVTNITIACNESWKDKNGDKQEKAEFVRITFYRKLAEIAGKYLKKGGLVYVEGRLETNKFTDKNGIERYVTGVVAENMQMLSGKSGGQNQGDTPADDSDIPF